MGFFNEETKPEELTAEEIIAWAEDVIETQARLVHLASDGVIEICKGTISDDEIHIFRHINIMAAKLGATLLQEPFTAENKNGKVNGIKYSFKYTIANRTVRFFEIRKEGQEL